MQGTKFEPRTSPRWMQQRGGELSLVPDTSSLASTGDPTEYRKIAGEDGFVFMSLPMVLGELDRLEATHRNPDMREKARDTIKRIKGYRKQGALMTVTNLTVKL